MGGKARETGSLAGSDQVSVGGAEERVAVEVGGSWRVRPASSVQVASSSSYKRWMPR